MEMKKFEVFIGSGKTMIKEVVDMISQTKTTCERIGYYSEVMMETISLPQLDNLEDSIRCKFLIEPFKVDKETKDNEILQTKEVDMATLKRLLMEQFKHQILAKTWIAAAEEKFNKDIVRGVFQI